MNIVPVLLIRNEELWIRHVVGALAGVFPHVIISDTGSTDTTIAQLAGLPNILLFEFGPQTPQGLTDLRQFMQDKAQQDFGATHIFLVDGDELYPTRYLRYIVEHPMPEDALSGFTSGIECCELENGELWFYAVGLNRQAIIPVDSHWKGVYPFESPTCYVPGSPRNHYFKSPDESYRFYHLHHTRRSRLDADVYLRTQKKNQFSMQDHPEIEPATFWLKSREEYRDEYGS